MEFILFVCFRLWLAGINADQMAQYWKLWLVVRNCTACHCVIGNRKNALHFESLFMSNFSFMHTIALALSLSLSHSLAVDSLSSNTSDIAVWSSRTVTNVWHTNWLIGFYIYSKSFACFISTIVLYSLTFTWHFISLCTAAHQLQTACSLSNLRIRVVL